MKIRFVLKQFVPILSVFLIYGCATPVPKSEITPKLYSGAEKNVAVGVIEARPYVLSGNKSAKFEGIIRGGFGIPHSIDRPRRPAEERFVDLLAGMIKDGLSDAGANVSIVSLSAGSSVDEAWKKMSETGAGRYVLMRVNESNWDVGGRTVTYKYDFGLIVAGKGGTVLGSKNLAGEQENSPSTKYNAFDMHSVIYRGLIESMFSEPAIKRGLGN
jgi:hypothetical protein